jgi:hypothetical protein
MLKYLLIGVLVWYVLNKLGFFRVRVVQQGPQSRKPPGGNVHVDSATRSAPKKKSFKGGDYVDYEEVK